MTVEELYNGLTEIANGTVIVGAKKQRAALDLAERYQKENRVTFERMLDELGDYSTEKERLKMELQHKFIKSGDHTEMSIYIKE